MFLHVSILSTLWVLSIATFISKVAGKMSLVTLRKLGYRTTMRCSSHYFSTYAEEDVPEVRQRIALVLGSSGCLGSAVAHHFKGNMGMKVVGADIVSLPDDSRTKLDSFIRLPTYEHPAAVADVTASLVHGLADVLKDGEELDVIICANGGWKGDPKLPMPGDDFMAGVKEYGDSINEMLEVNLFPVLAAGYAANRFMADEGEFKPIGQSFADKAWNMPHIQPVYRCRTICRHRISTFTRCDPWYARLWPQQSRNASRHSDTRRNHR